MVKKRFFAAFVIDEERYTPEPRPVDRNFVCSDLAQSNFGEQPGVLDFIVWDSLEELIAEEREPKARQLAPPAVVTNRPAPTFRDHLSPAMRDAPAFEYYEVRPCIESDNQVTSYADEAEFNELIKAQSLLGSFRTFWSLYGVDTGVRTAIGDFVSKDAAHDMMNAILAVAAAARNIIDDARHGRCTGGSGIEKAAGNAADWLDDMINQSSNRQRI